MFETSTFLSVWYWLFLALFWSLIANWTFGVSKWALDGAKSAPEEKPLIAALGRRSIANAARLQADPPLFSWAVQAFLVGAIATMAILRSSEVAQGLMFIAVPMTGFNIWRLREAQRLQTAQPDDDMLLKRIAEIRLIKQVLGAVSISAAVVYGMWLHRGDISWYMGG